jgi:hypothetical protein
LTDISFSNAHVIGIMIGMALFQFEEGKWSTVGGIMTGTVIGTPLGPLGMAAGFVGGLASSANVRKKRTESEEERKELQDNKAESGETHIYDPDEYEK